jgi:hypothetical protein
MVRSSQSITATKRVAGNRQKPTKRTRILGALFRLAGLALIWAIVWGAINPTRAIPPGWNPLAPLQVTEPVTLFTNWRLERALNSPEACIDALSTAASIDVLDDFEATDQCHILGRVDLAGVGLAWINPVETTCAIALRMAMWEQHSLQPAAVDLLDTTVTGIDQIGSYDCREMRTTLGGSNRMSTHATAEAIDISGFQFADGTATRLIDDWDATGAKSQFLHSARDGACDWFRLTLSPDYNNLHADHLHLQLRGWGSCK